MKRGSRPPPRPATSEATAAASALLNSGQICDGLEQEVG